jgi:hypothetical protein
LTQLLATRLRIEDGFRRHPEIRERRIVSPVYLTGLPRTGTSALFNLLAIDPAARPLLTWEGMNPDPVDGLSPGEIDPRLAAVRAAVERDRERNPDFDKIHYARAEGPEECVLLLAYTFCDVQLGMEALLSPYREWLQAQDLGPAYAYYADLLRMLDWQRPGQRWLLKSPAHLWALDVLVDLFPDACLLWTHRDPHSSIASYCSMMAALMGIRESVDPKTLGPVVLEYLARKLERGLAARDRCDPGRFLDVEYERFVSDPLATMERIYAHFELPLSGPTRDAMSRHVRDNPQGKHGSHRYALEEFGLTPNQVTQRLSGYIDRFDLGSGA